MILAQESRWPWARWAGRKIPYLGWEWRFQRGLNVLHFSLSPYDLPWFHTTYEWWDDDHAGVGISFGTSGSDQIVSLQLEIPAGLARWLPGL